MDETKAMLNAILENQQMTNAKLEAMQMDIHHMKGDIVKLQQDMTIVKQDISDIKSGQERQDRILESLALRSLEQEAILREMRRV